MPTPYAFDEPTARKMLRMLRSSRYVNSVPAQYPRKKRLPRQAGGDDETAMVRVNRSLDPRTSATVDDCEHYHESTNIWAGAVVDYDSASAATGNPWDETEDVWIVNTARCTDGKRYMREGQTYLAQKVLNAYTAPGVPSQIAAERPLYAVFDNNADELLTGTLTMASKTLPGIRGNNDNNQSGTDNAQTDTVELASGVDIQATNRTGRYVFDGSRVMVMGRRNKVNGNFEYSIISSNSADVILVKAISVWPNTSTNQTFTAQFARALNGYPRGESTDGVNAPTFGNLTVDYNPSDRADLSNTDISWGSINDMCLVTVNALGQYKLAAVHSRTAVYWFTATLAADITSSGDGSTSGTCTISQITGIGVNRSTSSNTAANNPWGEIGDIGAHVLGYASISPTGVTTYTVTKLSNYDFTNTGNTYAAPRYTP